MWQHGGRVKSMPREGSMIFRGGTENGQIGGVKSVVYETKSRDI